MKLTVKSYIEPVDIDITKNNEIVQTLHFDGDFNDGNVVKAVELGKELVEMANTLSDSDDLGKALADVADCVTPLIDLMLGDGATATIAAAVTAEQEPKAAVHTLVDIANALNAECAERNKTSRVSTAARYLDEEA